MSSKNIFRNLKDWCNGNQGVLAFLALIVTVVSAIPFTEIDFKGANPFFRSVLQVLIFKITIPFYLILIVVFTMAIYFIRLKRKFAREPVSLTTLKGTWRCEWGDKDGEEVFLLNENGNYYIDGVHYFNLTQFNFDSAKRLITFYKTSIRPRDKRNVFNSVKVINNELLEGKEEDYKIKYIKLSS